MKRVPSPLTFSPKGEVKAFLDNVLWLRSHH